MQQATPPIDRLISKKMAADILGVTTRTIDNYLKDKRLTRIKFGKPRSGMCRIRLSEVQALIESCTDIAR